MSWNILLPILFQVILFILQRVNASRDTVARFQALVQAAKDDGLISVQASDRFSSLHDKLMQRFKEEQNDQDAARPGHSSGD